MGGAKNKLFIPNSTAPCAPITRNTVISLICNDSVCSTKRNSFLNSSCFCFSQDGTYRQFFRLVMSRVSLWYEDHSTPNPNGVKPNPDVTKIVRGNKFGTEGVYVVE